MSYLIGAQNVISIPLYARHSLHFANGHGRLDITIGPKQTMGRQLENVGVDTVPEYLN
jgi:AP-3 complex subunit mu